jgi:hypothetical protein
MAHVRSNTTAKIRVDETDEIVEVPFSYLDWVIVPGKEGGGGAQREHWADYSFDDVVVTWKVFEYPPGKIEDFECDVVGGECVEDFVFFLEP